MRSHCIIILQLVFLKLNIIFVRLSHVNSNVFIFTAPEDSTVWNNQVYLFIVLLLGHFGCFQLFISIYAVIHMIVSTSMHMSEGFFT